MLRNNFGVKLVSLTQAFCKNLIEARAENIRTIRHFVSRSETQAHRRSLSRINVQNVMSRRFCSTLFRIHGLALAAYDIFMKGVLHEGLRIRDAEEPAGIRFIFGEEKIGCALAMKQAAAIGFMLQLDCDGLRFIIPALRRFA